MSAQQFPAIREVYSNIIAAAPEGERPGLILCRDRLLAQLIADTVCRTTSLVPALARPAAAKRPEENRAAAKQPEENRAAAKQPEENRAAAEQPEENRPPAVNRPPEWTPRACGYGGCCNNRRCGYEHPVWWDRTVYAPCKYGQKCQFRIDGRCRYMH